jgi:protein involved in ribonucleotide reduction
LIVYFSNASGYTHRFITKLGLPAVRIPLLSKEAELFTVEEDFVLIVPTYGSKTQGHVPRQVIKFLNNKVNRDKLRGVIGAGNMNFGNEFGIAADIISAKCGVPTLYRFELAGTPEDVEKVREGIDKFVQ